MSWLGKLYETYDAVRDNKALEEADRASLTAVGHTWQNAHVNIVLNAQGDFLSARVMPAKTAVMLPVTESSESRTSGEAPHPLSDKIQYVAQDYPKYGGEKKSYFEGYLKQLSKWCDSADAHPKIQAVRSYVSKGRVLEDLIQAKIFHLDEKGHLLNKWEREEMAPEIFSVLPKTKGEIEPSSALICWSVEIVGDPSRDLWTDTKIQTSWSNYLMHQDG